MNKKIHLLCCLSIALVIFFIMLSDTHATVLKKMNTKELTNRANAIVVGKVKSILSQWGDDGTKIYTCITVSVEKCVKGTIPSSEITIRQLGGEVGGIGLKVVGAPEYTEGEDILAFLEGERLQNRQLSTKPNDYFQCVGMAQGKYTIKTDESTRRRILVREIDRFEEKRLDLRSPEEGERKLFLDDFISQINAIIDNEEKK